MKKCRPGDNEVTSLLTTPAKVKRFKKSKKNLTETLLQQVAETLENSANNSDCDKPRLEGINTPHNSRVVQTFNTIGAVAPEPFKVNDNLNSEDSVFNSFGLLRLVNITSMHKKVISTNCHLSLFKVSINCAQELPTLSNQCNC